jgi:hypothetical protein
MQKIQKDERRASFGILSLELGIYLGFARLHRCAKHCGQGFWDLGFPARGRDLGFAP